MKTWNRERKRTRDRLLNYDSSIMPFHPSTASIPVVYPWEQTQLSMLSHQIYKIALSNGYTGNEQLLFRHFNGSAFYYYNSITDFPMRGILGDLYFDLSTQVLYYYAVAPGELDPEKIALVGGAIVGYSIVTNETYLYLPVRALPMEDIILNSGTAAEFID